MHESSNGYLLSGHVKQALEWYAGSCGWMTLPNYSEDCSLAIQKQDKGLVLFQEHSHDLSGKPSFCPLLRSFCNPQTSDCIAFWSLDVYHDGNRQFMLFKTLHFIMVKNSFAILKNLENWLLEI